MGSEDPGWMPSDDVPHEVVENAKAVYGDYEHVDTAKLHEQRQKEAAGIAISISPHVLRGFAGLNGKAKHILEQCLASGEPFIVFRAKDLFTPMVISHYLNLLEQTFGHDFNLDQQESLTEWRRRVVEWQRANAHRVRYPD